MHECMGSSFLLKHENGRRQGLQLFIDKDKSAKYNLHYITIIILTEELQCHQK